MIQDYEVERRMHPENFLSRSELESEEEEEILEEEGFIEHDLSVANEKA